MRSGPSRDRALARLRALLFAVLGFAPGPLAAGNLFDAEELAVVARAADEGNEAARAWRRGVRRDAARPWRWEEVSGRYGTTWRLRGRACHPSGEPGRGEALKEGAPDALAKVLAHHLAPADDPDARTLAAEARAHVLDLVDAEGFDGPLGISWNGLNQCILELAISIPVWIETAILLEDTPVWSAVDRTAFARWLAETVYPRVAWASRVRRNNWGAAGSLSASLIARYVGATPGAWTLVEVAPAARQLTPEEAWREHDAQQHARVATAWRGDSDCPRFGIQDHGGIPDELRRGSGGCDAASLPSQGDRGLTYQTMHVEALVFHAEALRRAGDPSLFQGHLEGGVPALLRAILFVIDNPTPGERSFAWGTRTGALSIAFRAYGDTRLRDAARAGRTFRGGRSLPYAGIALAEPLPPSEGR